MSLLLVFMGFVAPLSCPGWRKKAGFVALDVSKLGYLIQDPWMAVLMDLYWVRLFEGRCLSCCKMV